jgi:hypothetical protein
MSERTPEDRAAEDEARKAHYLENGLIIPTDHQLVGNPPPRTPAGE